jgi:hypothetical protein
MSTMKVIFLDEDLSRLQEKHKCMGTGVFFAKQLGL